MAGRKRRNVTNTIAEASPTRNVYSHTSQRSDRPERRKKTGNKSSRKASFSRFVAKGTSGLMLLAIIAIAAYLLSLSTQPIVRTLGEGNSAVQINDNATYEQAANELLSKSIWNHSKLTIHTKDIKTGLEQQFPELESVSVVVPFLGNKPVVYIEPAQPALVLVATNGTYVLDQSGKVMIMQANLPANIKLDGIPVVTDQSDLKAELNKQALTKNDIVFIRTVLAQLNAKQVKHTTLVLPAGASELDVHIAGQPYLVKFNLQSFKTAREQTGTFLAAQQELTRQHITPAQYIDVRLEGRAYYQ